MLMSFTFPNPLGDESVSMINRWVSRPRESELTIASIVEQDRMEFALYEVD